MVRLKLLWLAWAAFLLLPMTMVTCLAENPHQETTALWLDRLLQDSWTFYKARFMPNQERVASNHYGGTISEGQSYAMLKAVWMGDRVVFDKTWQWTQQHLQRRSHDHLLGWRWGERNGQPPGLLETDNATDADQDIAYALLLAGDRWQHPAYTQAARDIIRDLWRENVRQIHGRYYLAPGTWDGFEQDGVLTLDPSYMAPYVYRRFAREDKAHATGWHALAQNVYPTLEACTRLTTLSLPPNWCGVRQDTGAIVFSDVQGPEARDFSYDAFRVFWRMGMDAGLGSQEARAYLQAHDALYRAWQKNAALPEGFSWQGEALGEAPSGFAHSALLAQRHVVSPNQASAHYAALLAPFYHAQGFWFNDYNDFLHSVLWLHLYTLTLPRTR